MNGSDEAVQVIIEAKADVNARDEVLYDDDCKVIEMMIAKSVRSCELPLQTDEDSILRHRLHHCICSTRRDRA